MFLAAVVTAALTLSPTPVKAPQADAVCLATWGRNTVGLELGRRMNGRRG